MQRVRRQVCLVARLMPASRVISSEPIVEMATVPKQNANRYVKRRSSQQLLKLSKRKGPLILVEQKEQNDPDRSDYDQSKPNGRVVPVFRRSFGIWFVFFHFFPK